MNEQGYIAVLEEQIKSRDEVIDRYMKVVAGWEELYAKRNVKQV